MAWIEVHQGLATHYKILHVAGALEISQAAAVGHMVMFWLWALDNFPEGRMGPYDGDARAAAVGARWQGDPAKFLDALIYGGFVDKRRGKLYIHDWEDYVGRLLEQRRHRASRARRNRSLYSDMALTRQVRQRDGDACRYCGGAVDWKNRKGPSGGTYDHVDPEGPNDLSNVVVACRRCNSTKARRLPEAADMVLRPLPVMADKSTIDGRKISATVPYRTVPNQDIHTHSPRAPAGAWLEKLRSIDGWSERGEPHLKSLMAWAKEKGLTDDELERSAIGLAQAKSETLDGYKDMASAFQRRINNGYDAVERRNGPEPNEGSPRPSRQERQLEEIREARRKHGAPIPQSNDG